MSNIIREGDVICPPVATYFGKRIGGDPLLVGVGLLSFSAIVRELDGYSTRCRGNFGVCIHQVNVEFTRTRFICFNSYGNLQRLSAKVVRDSKCFCTYSYIGCFQIAAGEIFANSYCTVKFLTPTYNLIGDSHFNGCGKTVYFGSAGRNRIGRSGILQSKRLRELLTEYIEVNFGLYALLVYGSGEDIISPTAGTLNSCLNLPVLLPSSDTVTIAVISIGNCFKPRNKVDNPVPPPNTTTFFNLITYLILFLFVLLYHILIQRKSDFSISLLNHF